MISSATAAKKAAHAGIARRHRKAHGSETFRIRLDAELQAVGLCLHHIPVHDGYRFNGVCYCDADVDKHWYGFGREEGIRALAALSTFGLTSGPGACA